MMRSGRRGVGSMLAALLLLTAACGDDGPKVLSADDLVTEINGVCRTADRALGDLEPDDDHYYDDASDTLQDALDALAKLKPAKDAKADFDDLVDNLGDQQDQLADLSKAVDDDDADALTQAGDELVSLQEASDDLTDSLGSHSCFGVDAVVVESGLSQDELVDEMNRICSAGKVKLDALEIDIADLSSFWNDAADIFAGMRDDLAALKAPSSLTQTYAEMLDGIDKMVTALRDVAEAGGFDFEPYNAAQAQATGKAAEIGADACESFASMDDGPGLGS